MNTPYIVGFFGKSEAGKSTCAAKLNKLLTDAGYKTNVALFAGPLKSALKILGIDSRSHPLYRDAAIMIGDGLRKLYLNYHVDLMVNEIYENYSDLDVLIIDDGRYPNESQIADLKILLKRSSSQSKMTDTQKTAASENNLDSIDYDIIARNESEDDPNILVNLIHSTIVDVIKSKNRKLANYVIDDPKSPVYGKIKHNDENSRA